MWSGPPRAGRVAEVVQEFGESPDCALGYNRQANYVVLDHGDGLGSLYLHLAEDSVIPPLGARVEQGDPLALTAHNGYICGPAHLHFTVLDMATPRVFGYPLL